MGEWFKIGPKGSETCRNLKKSEEIYRGKLRKYKDILFGLVPNTGNR